MGVIKSDLDGVLLTRLRRIETVGGDVFHAMKNSDPGFNGFGEAYFSAVQSGCVKGWKRHTSMTLNLVVPAGEIQVSVLDEFAGNSQDFILGPDRADTYQRLTIPAGLWVAFGGRASGTSMLLNLASIPHDPQEAETRALSTFTWLWV